MNDEHERDGLGPPGDPPALAQVLQDDAAEASSGAVALALAVENLDDEQVTAGLVESALLPDSITVLARAQHACSYQLGRRLSVALTADVLAFAPRNLLRQLGWSGAEAAALVDAAGFIDDQPQLVDLWRRGLVGPDKVAAIARATAKLTAEQRASVIGHLLPHVTAMSVPALRRWLAMAVALIRPQDADAREQDAHDGRYLAFSEYDDVVSFQGQLPALEGQAFKAAITALAESLRAEGDGLTRGQRNADALITLVNAAAATDQLPTSNGGLPVAATVTIGLSEAERVAASRPRATTSTLEDAFAAGAFPSRLGDLGASHTLGDAAARFAMCSGTFTGVLVHDPVGDPITTALGATRLEPLAVGQALRTATSAQRKALSLRDGGCVVPGCSRPPAECQAHHVLGWALGGKTDLDNLALLCWAHHRQVDLGRWVLTRNPEPAGPYWLVERMPRKQRRRAAHAYAA